MEEGKKKSLGYGMGEKAGAFVGKRINKEENGGGVHS